MFKRIRTALVHLLQVEEPAPVKATTPASPQRLEAKPEGQKRKRRKPNSGNRSNRARHHCGDPRDNTRAHQFAEQVRQGLGG
jgi:hypothetical protein